MGKAIFKQTNKQINYKELSNTNDQLFITKKALQTNNI